MKNKILYNPSLPSIWTTLVILTIFFVIGYTFAVSPKLPGFADDSAIYILMANSMSPYSDPPASHLASFSYFHLPPAFPFFISVLGINDSVEYMHIFVLIPFDGRL